MNYAHFLYYVQIGLLVCVAVPGGGAFGADAPQKAADGLWDPQRYIGVDEIQRGMEGYCLTDYGEAGIEKFPLKVVNIIHEYEPGHDLILIMGLDERFKHTGPVAGCSGSPVYLDGRLAGALARGWVFQKDPLYGVTPIQEMLQVGASKGSSSASSSRTLALKFDFSKPIDFAEIDKQLTSLRPMGGRSQSGATALPCPLQISGLPPEACRYLAPQLETMGFLAVPGISGTVPAGAVPAASFTPGGTLTIPLVSGDIKLETLGTVTEVRGNRIYGFGHSFLGFGPTELPLAGGQIYTVVSQMMTSFKIGAAGEIIGAITTDESVGVTGEIGAKAKMIPLSVRVQPCNGAEPKTYNCQMVCNQVLTPVLARATLTGATMPFGEGFPPDHTIDYQATIRLEDGQTIQFANTSTGMQIAEMVTEASGSLALLMNNPYGCPEVTGLEASVSVSSKNIASYIWSVNVADSTIKRGEDIDLEVVIESFMKEKRKYQVSLNVPKYVAPGKYNLMILGSMEYEGFLRKVVPYRFIATNRKTLVEALNEVLNVSRTKLYCLLVLPPEGIAIDRAELPGLPETKSMILQSNKWAMPAQPYPQWVEKAVETGTVVGDKEMVQITVEP